MPFLHRSLGALADKLASGLDHSWRRSIGRLTARLAALHAARQLSRHNAIHATRDTLLRWPDAVLDAYEPEVDRAFAASFLLGHVSAELGTTPDHGDEHVLEWLKHQPAGFVPALRNLAAEQVQAIEQIIAAAYDVTDPLDPITFDVDSLTRAITERADIGASRARLIARTETAKITALGRINAWESDPDRELFDYLWIPAHDNRTKDVSLLFEAGNPYTFAEMKNLWMVRHNEPQLVKNRHTGKLEYQTSAYNCRCTCARVPKSPKKLFYEGKITRQQYSAMTVGG